MSHHDTQDRKIAEQEQTIRERVAELTYRLQTWDDSHAEMTAKVLAERDSALERNAELEAQAKGHYNTCKFVMGERDRALSELATRNMDVKNLLVILDAQIEISECDIEDEDRVIVEQIRMEVHARVRSNPADAVPL